MALTTYNDASGVFVNGTTPLSAANMNAIRNFLIAAGAMWDSNVSVDGNGYQTLIGQKINAAAAASVNGTSGTATLYMPQRGTWKVAYVLMNNYRNGSGSAQTLALPVAFTTVVYVRSLGAFQIQLLSGGSAQNIDVITALATAGGSTTTQTNIAAYSFGRCASGIDTISLSSGGSSGQTSLVFLEGV